MSEKEHKVSRRQFLSYALMGVGGFMAAATVSPMVRFALDPALDAGGDTEFVNVATVDELTEEPQRFDFKVEVEDAWYTSEQSRTAWIYKEGDKVIALSPVCTHLGCTVNWDTNEDHPNQFFCPCHLGRFEKSGQNVANTPPTRPLDLYDTKLEDGNVLLGGTIQRRTV
ncbi:ubiquinol-cytochrome c reductase iron-sulfur subunit [Evansella cellulosilytica]|uniref:Menaquinol:cytochrome c reductase iron-sulfur subunit n=1 Tax=Evansella cellulosilytica (strain ATCC 21833 / DSM 2522 / FERM P-1141 / JCM 9156 / N-4) TaxID=649639 RepID=E6TZH7_EVAC2|nr:ubiquinol-cytochrome c reductase iron-sulfur subunit [Evansella cellulosilytica]ADU30151.1 Rieske (2Fe-2S) iron-sulfur domain [Evansella cellulosilytica DSM 2522]